MNEIWMRSLVQELDWSSSDRRIGVYDDGVQVIAVPRWRHFGHKPWQKVIKGAWVKIEKGDHGWAHLTMRCWPDRVREKCKTDKSIAIAHNLEDLYIEPAPKPGKARAKKKPGDGK